MKIFLVVLKISEPPSFPINTKAFVRELWQVHNDEDDIFEEVCDDNKDISEEVFNDWEEFVEEVSDDIFIIKGDIFEEVSDPWGSVSPSPDVLCLIVDLCRSKNYILLVSLPSSPIQTMNRARNTKQKN